MQKKGKEFNGNLTVLEEACRDAGLKLTQQRLELFRELAAAEDHPTAEILHKRLLARLPTLSLDTVYRTLATFEKYSLVKRVETLESQARFEMNLPKEKHHHLICRQCGQITDFEWSSFDSSRPPPALQKWGRIETQNATLYGLCNKCFKAGHGKG